MKNRKFEQENSPLKMVLYSLAVCLLLACIVFQVYRSKEKQKEYKARIEQLQMYETEYIRPERQTESETETEIPKKAAVTTEKETEPADIETAAKQKCIMVLNGTGKEGIAGYWRDQLMQDGYTDVILANYLKKAEEYTLIYSKDRKLAEHFQQLFPDSKIRITALTEGIEMPEGTAQPENVDVYLVIGSKDTEAK